MKTLIPVLLTFVTSLSFAQSRVGQIVKCPEELKGTCRQFGPQSISTWDAQNNNILISTNGSLSTLNFPYEDLSVKLAFQYQTKIHEGFYNTESKEWVVFNYQSTYGRNSVALIPENKMNDRDLITEIISFSNNIHKNTSFQGDKIIVTSDDGKQSIQFKREQKAIKDLIAEGMKLYLKNDTLYDTNMFEAVKGLHDQCGTEVKCLDKAKKALVKTLSKEYKEKRSKEAVEYLKNYSPFNYPMNQYLEFLEGCVASPEKCTGMNSDNQKAFYRLNFNVDQGTRALSYNLFMPEAFSVLYNYIPLKAMTQAK